MTDMQILISLKEMTSEQRDAVERLMDGGYEMEAANMREATLFHEDEMKVVAVNSKGAVREIHA